MRRFKHANSLFGVARCPVQPQVHLSLHQPDETDSAPEHRVGPFPYLEAVHISLQGEASSADLDSPSQDLIPLDRVWVLRLVLPPELEAERAAFAPRDSHLQGALRLRRVRHRARTQFAVVAQGDLAPPAR